VLGPDGHRAVGSRKRRAIGRGRRDATEIYGGTGGSKPPRPHAVLLDRPARVRLTIARQLGPTFLREVSLARAVSCAVMKDPSGVKLPRGFYTRPDVVEVARDLLGRLLVVPARGGHRVSGIIVETEAYRGPEDRASHAYGGRRTPRTETMYGRGGTAYVYFVYGMYHQFNVVTGVADVPHAVLVRALEPVEGVNLMRRRRDTGAARALTSGPGKLCIALGIDRRLDTTDLLGERVWIEPGRRVPPSAVEAGPRIGIDYAGEWVERPWRFWLRDSPFVSRTPPGRPGARGPLTRAGGSRSG
jgi:DNA-3-methyladenine glycosylase